MYHDAEGRLIRSEAPASFRPGGTISGSVAVDERGDLDVLGGTQPVDPEHHDDAAHHEPEAGT
jgi:hypothetical protein